MRRSDLGRKHEIELSLLASVWKSKVNQSKSEDHNELAEDEIASLSATEEKSISSWHRETSQKRGKSKH